VQSLCIFRLKRTGKRDKIFLATKFGITPGTGNGVNGKPEHVRLCITQSLEKLGVSTVDLYYLHVSSAIISTLLS